MRIAFSQINPCLGDISYNQSLILKDINRAAEKKAEILIFPELSLVGYPPLDLLDQELLFKKSESATKSLLKKIPNGLLVVVGTITKDKAGNLYNSALCLKRDKIVKTINKILLPNYDIFDEARYFQKGKENKNLLKIKGKNILLTICEDLWYFHPDYKKKYKNIYKGIDKKSIDLVVNISASPFTKTKLKDRDLLFKNVQKYFRSNFLYVNLVGCQDSVIFDGNSLAINKKGDLLTKSLSFQEDLNFVDFSKNEGGKRHQDRLSLVASIHKALVLGLRDYITKSGFTKVHLGLSGGIDSALVAALAVDALGPNNVTCIAMPTKFNAQKSLDLAKKLSENLSVDFMSIDIEKHYQNFANEINNSFSINSFGTSHENLQSRIRGLLLMAFSNSKNSLLLATGNKSEYACGYSTLYGDMCGGLAPIGDLLKTEVFELAKWYNREIEIIPEEIILRPPSAELRPNQKDEDSLPPYKKLDKDIENFVVENKALKGQSGQELMKKIYLNEFKRFQSPPILKISKKAFGFGRRYPIVQRLL